MPNKTSEETTRVTKANEALMQKSDVKLISLVFMALRLLTFLTAITLTAFITLPLEGFLTSFSYPKLAGGAVAIALLAGVAVYFIAIPRTSITSAAIDLEAIIIVAVGTVFLIIAGTITTLTSGGKNIITFGVVLMGISMFYIYKIIRGGLKIQHDNEALKRQYGELLEVDKEKTNFITVTSHQLRTPLTEIKWSLGTVLQKDLDATTHASLQKSLDSVNRLVDIVNAMVGTGAAENREDSLLEKTVDAATLIENAVGELANLATQKEVSVNFTSPERKVPLRGYPDKLLRAIKNIIDNAIRYAPKGDVRVTLDIDGDNASIRVQDSGIGIDPQDSDRVFRKFFRGKNALLIQPDGSGMGLFIAKTIIEEQGGTINFVSTPGKGSIFMITLPLAKS